MLKWLFYKCVLKLIKVNCLFMPILSHYFTIFKISQTFLPERSFHHQSNVSVSGKWINNPRYYANIYFFVFLQKKGVPKRAVDKAGPDGVRAHGHIRRRDGRARTAERRSAEPHWPGLSVFFFRNLFYVFL